jgi:hypothetical protein
MGPEGPLLCATELATGSCPEPNNNNGNDNNNNNSKNKNKNKKDSTFCLCIQENPASPLQKYIK